MKVEFFLRRPLLGGVIGILIAAAALSFLPSVWSDYQRLPDVPARITFAAAVSSAGGDAWVTLTDPTVRCDLAVRDGDRRYVPMTGGATPAVIVAGTDDVCREGTPREVTGTLVPMSDRLENDLRDRGLVTGIDSGTPPRMLWTHGGKGNALAGLIVLPILAILGLSIYPLIVRERRKRERDGTWPPRE